MIGTIAVVVTANLFQAMLILAPILYLGWKIFKKTKLIGPLEADLVWERPTIDAYEATFIDKPVGFWTEMIQLVGLGRRKGGNDQRVASISA
jgi:yeast amino acid transporter